MSRLRKLKAPRPQSEIEIDKMYDAWIAYKDRGERKKKHPSRAEFGELINFIPIYYEVKKEAIS
jgi:hypothetical protein